MKQYFIAVATLALFVVACKKDENIIKGTPTKYIQSQVYTTGDSLAFEYNIDRSVFRVLYSAASGSTVETTPFYDIQGRVIKTDIAYTGQSYTMQTLVYNAVSKITKVNFFSAMGASYYDSISYKNGIMDTIYQYNSGKITRKYAYNWDTKGNISKMETIYLEESSVHTRTTTYTYDNKINPFLKLRGYYSIIFDEYDLASTMSANNLLTSASADQGAGYTGSDNNTYKYDSDGYPVAMTLRSTSQYTGQDPRVDSSVLVVHYGR